MSSAKKCPGILTGQLIHLMSLVLLVALVWRSWVYLNRPYPAAFWIAIVFPVAHQIFVWMAWRTELKGSLISKSIGFRIYAILFFILFAGRFISLIALAWLDFGKLNLHIIPHVITTSILVIPGLYAMYSVIRYFGLLRASGADHFILKYRKEPLVNKGIFRYTDNGMYIYAFLLFWAIAFGFNSSAAIIVAAFSHIYIWVHYYSTEKPDMEYLYR